MSSHPAEIAPVPAAPAPLGECLSDGLQGAPLSTTTAPAAEVETHASQLARPFVEKIKAAHIMGVEAIMRLADTLIEARTVLKPKGLYYRIFADSKKPLPGVMVSMSSSTADKITSIRERKALSDPSTWKALPSSWTTLYALCGLSESEVRRGIEGGEITPDMTVQQAKAYASALYPKMQAQIKAKTEGPEQVTTATVPIAGQNTVKLEALAEEISPSEPPKANEQAAPKYRRGSAKWIKARVRDLEEVVHDLRSEAASKLTRAERLQIGLVIETLQHVNRISATVGVGEISLALVGLWNQQNGKQLVTDDNFEEGKYFSKYVMPNVQEAVACEPDLDRWARLIEKIGREDPSWFTDDNFEFLVSTQDGRPDGLEDLEQQEGLPAWASAEGAA
jgi:hypothetical protein